LGFQSPELCGRFNRRVIRNVKIQASPKWLKERLEASGVASISNVVDISNYVMLELGHPSTHSITTRFATQNCGAPRQAKRKNAKLWMA